jgi:hypothetical protein
VYTSSGGGSGGPGRDLLFLHIKGVDDAAHDKNVPLRVRLLEAVDALLGQLIRRLWEANAAEYEHEGNGNGKNNSSGGARAAAAAAAGGEHGHAGASAPIPPVSSSRPSFALVVTGDHSTPVLFGDHSHEPVPFAAALLEDVVSCLGGPTALAAAHPLRKISMPPVQCDLEPGHLATETGDAAGGLAGSSGAAGNIGAAGSGGGSAPPTATLPSSSSPPPSPPLWDSVSVFSEAAMGAGGCLGRFPGSEVMGIVRGLVGARAVAAPSPQAT